MNSVILLGDPHIGKSISLGKTALGSNLNTRLADQLNLLDWTLEQAIENHSSHIMISGDVFEEPKPHPSIITLFMSWLKKCQAYEIHVHIVMGNHDVLRSGYVYTSPLDIISEAELENVSIYKDITTIFLGTTAFTLLPFRDRKSFGVTSNAQGLSTLKEVLGYELSSIPLTYKKIVFGHLAIEGSIFIGDEVDDSNNELFCPLDMFAGYDYVWMGHVHKPQVLQKKNPYIAHIGSMDVSNFGESDHDKIIVILNLDTAEYNTQILPTRSLKKISIVVPKDTEDTTQYVLSEISKNNLDLNKSIVKLDITLSCQELQSVNKTELEKHLVDLGAFGVSSISQTKKVNLLKKDSNSTLEHKMDVISAIKAYSNLYVEEQDRSDFIDLATSIYSLYQEETKA
jgi:exonuclease SbcD